MQTFSVFQSVSLRNDSVLYTENINILYLLSALWSDCSLFGMFPISIGKFIKKNCVNVIGLLGQMKGHFNFLYIRSSVPLFNHS